MPGKTVTVVMRMTAALPTSEQAAWDALTGAGANDVKHGSVLTLAAVIRARNVDLPGALAALQEATERHHADGNRALL